MRTIHEEPTIIEEPCIVNDFLSTAFLTSDPRQMPQAKHPISQRTIAKDDRKGRSKRTLKLLLREGSLVEVEHVGLCDRSRIEAGSPLFDGTRGEHLHERFCLVVVARPTV